ncbi:MAG: hypothetical protein HY908_31505 [Myxococcales bacterium]|nr:hypothetical protein [Myxococcales bacterium]
MLRSLCFASLLAGVLCACGGRSPMSAEGHGSGATGGTNGTGAGGSDGGGSPTGGSGGSGATGGVGGTGGTPFNPIDCLACVGQSCPEVLACITDSACAQGILCTVQNCLAGGQPDLLCVAGCFNGDLQAAMDALQAFSCIFGTCGDYCSGLPLPGGGFPPGG